MSDWYYVDENNDKKGPYSTEELVHALSDAADKYNRLVWSKGMEDWTEAQNIKEVFELISEEQPPPIPTASDNQPADNPREMAQPATAAETNADRLDHTQQSNTHPWRRYFAKCFDLFVFAFIGTFILGVMFPYLDWEDPSGLGNQFIITIVVVILWAIFEIISLGMFGTTFGRALFKISIDTIDGTKITWKKSLGRTLHLTFAGLGLGIPIIALFTQIAAYMDLKKNGHTSWDYAQELTVSHGEISTLRWIVIVLAMISLLVVSAWLNAL